MSARALSLLIIASLCGCKERGVTALATDLSVPDSVDFGVVYVGFSETQSIEITNHGRAPVDFTVSVLPPFHAVDTLRVPGGSTARLDVELIAESFEKIEGTLHLTAEELAYDVHLLAAPAMPPTCEPSSDCVTSHFDPATGCVEAPLEDGASCGASDRCITAGQCFQGACRGRMIDCDDGDACTSDACNPKQGCIHPPVLCAAPSSPCEVAVCSPLTGCGTAPAMDGARCGDNDCGTAHVCIAGQCEARPAPEGSECGEASTCRAAGHCVQGACEPAPAEISAPRWRYTPSSEMNVMRVVVDKLGNTFALIGTNMIFLTDGGLPPDYPLWLYSFDHDGHPRFAVNLSSETPGLENGIALMADPDADVVYLVARTYNYGTATPHRVVVAQARDSHTGTRLWENDLHQDIPILNSSSGEMTLDVTRLMLLNSGLLGISLIEGDSLHQAYVKGLSTTTGVKLWQTQRPGHMFSGASGNGEVWEGSAACWSSEYRISRITPAGATLNQRLYTTSMLAFDQDRALIRTNGTAQLAWLNASFVESPIPLVPSHSLAYGSYARIEGPLVTVVTQDAQTKPWLERYDAAANTWRWSTPLGAGAVSQVWSLRDGGTAASLSFSDGGTELVTVSATGDVTERCPYGASWGVAVVNGLYVTREGTSITAYDVPGREAATSGWTGPDGFMGTGRYR